MQTADELMNDLIEALQISSTYRKQQERQWKQQAVCALMDQEDSFQKTLNMH